MGEMAGPQLAIWNAIYDEDFLIGRGTFIAYGGDAEARAFANSFLAELQNQGPVTGETAIYLTSQGNYGPDMLALAPVTPVPEPASLILLGLGLGAAGLVSKRKAR